MKKVIVLHDFDGKPYFKALEQVADVVYLNTRPFRFMLRDLLKYRKIQRETLNSLLFLFKLPFIRQHTILLGMAPFNIRLLIYSFLCKHNRVLLHTSWHQWQGGVPFEYPEPLRGWLKRAWRNRLPRFASIVAVTEETRRSVSQFLPEITERIVTIPHVVDIDPIDDKAFEDKWQQSPGHFLFTGRLTAAKGVSTWLELAEYAEKNAPELEFHIAGRGEAESQVIDYQQRHANLNFHGFISDREQLKSLMARSHFLLLPSRKINGWEELFGLVVIEAMSQGCVVVASDHIGPREIITDEEDGLLYREEEFAAKARQLIADLNLNKLQHAQRAEKGLATSHRYSMKVIANMWSSLINKF
ncbi:glycosyltransferase family 4 protein [Pantoea coffeiphila]|uniref:glycosyltransferase family 4 protein n=1 Tax=Pantoea coffeiphila TaxID=1465635 RepID=UPI0019617D93|nr:glycosyltransferase family 4 protein [Pantoea coffeiphila]MBM7343769.1 glycosyltransferase involved in cell wall biosynthesis [Pantoea coffeiphila]